MNLPMYIKRAKMATIIVTAISGGVSMAGANRHDDINDFEQRIREYLRQGKEKLIYDLVGTREAIKLIACEKTKEFVKTMDKGLDRSEREFLSDLIVSSMYQSFCYGYGIGKIEGRTNNKIFL